MDHLRILREIDIGIPEERILACWHAQQLLSMDFPQHERTCRHSQARGVLPAMEQLTADEAFPAGLSIAATHQQPKWHPEPPPPPKRRLALVPTGQLQHQFEPSSAKDKTLMLSTERPPGYPSWAKWFGVDPMPQANQKT
jgi:hypothetical protein